MSKTTLRRFWFQVHKWIGLVLAILIIPLSLTGAALVWDEALDHALNPQRYAVSAGTPIDPQIYVDAARGALSPGDRIATLTLPQGEAPAIVAAAQPGKPLRGGPPARTMVWIDPPSGRVLDHANSGTGVLRVVHNIHGNLLVPGIGRQVVGWIGVAMALSCFTGLWLWWPSVGRWTRGFRWRRQRNTDANLHHLFGFWVALPLFVLSLTGAWISFPQVFGGTMGMPMRGPRPQPLANPRLGIDTVIASAQAVAAADVQQVAWPTDQAPNWTLTFAGGTQAEVADATGRARIVPRKAEDTSRLMRRIHDGTRMGLVWQFVIFLGGILPAVLAVTGVIMWWRARGWRAKLALRQRTGTAA